MSESVEPTLVERCEEGLKPVKGGDVILWKDVSPVGAIPHSVQYEHSKRREVLAGVYELALKKAEELNLYVVVDYTISKHVHSSSLRAQSAELLNANFNLFRRV